MKESGLDELFLDELQDLYSCEIQSGDLLPSLIELASLPDLKHTLELYLKQFKIQLERVGGIFLTINSHPKENICQTMRGMIEKAQKLTADRTKSPVLDAAIISVCQKMLHYKIASCAILSSFARHLDLDSEIIELLHDTLNEDEAADKKLGKIAKGSFFASGVYEAAADLKI